MLKALWLISLYKQSKIEEHHFTCSHCTRQLSLVLPMRINENYPFMEKNSHIVIMTCWLYDFYTVMNAFLLICILGVKTLNVQMYFYQSWSIHRHQFHEDTKLTTYFIWRFYLKKIYKKFKCQKEPLTLSLKMHPLSLNLAIFLAVKVKLSVLYTVH